MTVGLDASPEIDPPSFDEPCPPTPGVASLVRAPRASPSAHTSGESATATEHGSTRASLACCPVKSLARMLADENTTSDIVTLLVELDPLPLRALLSLETSDVVIERETPAGGRRRLDLVVRRSRDRHPLAVVEVKCASDLHGDQLEEYDAWVDSQQPVPSRWYWTVDGEHAREAWQPMRLADVFQGWTSSSDPHAAWLAREASSLLTAWDAEADGVIGDAQGHYVPDIVARRAAREIHAQLAALGDESEAQAFRTNAGQPMVMAWRHDPRAEAGVWLGVDIRSQCRGDPRRPWLFRPCIDVVESDLSATEARLRAHDHAVALLDHLSGSALTSWLSAAGREDLAGLLTPSDADGFRHRPDRHVLEAWRAQLEAGSPPGRHHPVFFHDRGTRLATQFTVDVTRASRQDLQDLCLLVLEHLVTADLQRA